jgi:hypothetical protein
MGGVGKLQVLVLRRAHTSRLRVKGLGLQCFIFAGLSGAG